MNFGAGIRTTPVVIVPSDLADAVPTLRSAWAGRDVRVIVEDGAAASNGTLQVDLPWDLPRLPRALRAIRPRLRYVLAIEPPPVNHADQLAADAMARLRAGDRTAIGDVFATWFDPAHAYLKVSLAEPRLASQTAQAAFAALLAEPARFDPAGERFGSFFVELLHEVAMGEGGGLVDPATGVPALGPRPRGGAVGRLAAVSDVDLLVFLHRIAPLERRVLVLRWIMGLDRDEVAEALALELPAVAVHEHAGIAALQRRIEAHGRCEHPRETRASMDSLRHESPVVRARRRALVGLGT